jgi:hypothetical protein
MVLPFMDEYAGCNSEGLINKQDHYYFLQKKIHMFSPYHSFVIVLFRKDHSQPSNLNNVGSTVMMTKMY